MSGWTEGAIEKRSDLVGQSGASSLIRGGSSSQLYMWGVYNDKPALRVSHDGGDNWSVYSESPTTPIILRLI